MIISVFANEEQWHELTMEAGEGLVLAIKVMDGAKRAKYAIAIHVLKQMGWITPSVAEALAETYLTIGRYKRLDVVGELSML